jgi:hypothetical protein
MLPTSGAGFAASPLRQASMPPNGRHVNCGTASSHCCPTKGVPIEQIARLVGHTGGSAVTETVYRKQLRPVINDGAVAMNELFPRIGSYSVGYSTRLSRSKNPGPEPQ